MSTVLTNRSPFRAALRYASCLRAPEIVALQGSPLLGFAFAVHQRTAESGRLLALLVAANICLVTHIFLINDWAEIDIDRADANKADRLFTSTSVSRHAIAGLMIVLLVVSLFLFSRLGAIPFYLAVAIAVASALYSLPPFHWKGRPIFSSVLHLVGGAVHFLLGYSVANVIDSRGIVIATFFALTFAAGHLTQEVRDYEEDARSEIRTNAVLFGRRRTFVAGLVLFTLAQALLCCLAVRGTLPRSLAFLIVLYPLHL